MKRLSDTQQAALGKTVRFGLGQLANPTPMYMKYIFRVLAFLSGLWALLPADLLNLPEDTISHVNKWLVVANSAMLFAIKFFGWQYEDTE